MEGKPEVAKSRYACGFCNKKFPQISLLNQHEIDEHSGKEFKCLECPFTCEDQTVYNHHVAVHHGKEKRIICPILNCNLNFGQRANLSLHMKTHEKFIRAQVSSPDPAPTIKNNCNSNNNITSNSNSNSSNSGSSTNIISCNNNYSNSNSNNNTNNKKKMYSCTYCDYETVHRENLTSHKRRAHPPALKKSTSTSSCSSSSSSSTASAGCSSSLSSPTYNSLKCTYCEYSCSERRQLLSHRKIHGDMYKRFKCAVCDKAFERKGHLDRHQNIHFKIKTKKKRTTNGRSNGGNVIAVIDLDDDDEEEDERPTKKPLLDIGVEMKMNVNVTTDETLLSSPSSTNNNNNNNDTTPNQNSAETTTPSTVISEISNVTTVIQNENVLVA